MRIKIISKPVSKNDIANQPCGCGGCVQTSPRPSDHKAKADGAGHSGKLRKNNSGGKNKPPK